MDARERGECCFGPEVDPPGVGLESGAEEEGDLRSDMPGRMPRFMESGRVCITGEVERAWCWCE